MINPHIVLSDEIISLRPLSLQDTIPLFEAVLESLPELEPWMDWAHAGYTDQEACQFLEFSERAWQEGKRFGFSIRENSNGAFLGSCWLSAISPVYRLANLGYWVRSSQTGKGIASRATRLVARFAFETLNLARVEIVMATGNYASQRVAEKAGSQREAILRNRILLKNSPVDAIMFSFIPQDFSLAFIF